MNEDLKKKGGRDGFSELLSIVGPVAVAITWVAVASDIIEILDFIERIAKNWLIFFRSIWLQIFNILNLNIKLEKPQLDALTMMSFCLGIAANTFIFNKNPRTLFRNKIFDRDFLKERDFVQLVKINLCLLIIILFAWPFISFDFFRMELGIYLFLFVSLVLISISASLWKMIGDMDVFYTSSPEGGVSEYESMKWFASVLVIRSFIRSSGIVGKLFRTSSFYWRKKYLKIARKLSLFFYAVFMQIILPLSAIYPFLLIDLATKEILEENGFGGFYAYFSNMELVEIFNLAIIPLLFVSIALAAAKTILPLFRAVLLGIFILCISWGANIIVVAFNESFVS